MIAPVVSAALHAIVTSVVLGGLLLALVAIVVKFGALRATVRHALWTVVLIATALMPCAGLGVSAYRAIAAPVANAARRTAGDLPKLPAAPGGKAPSAPAPGHLASPQQTALRSLPWPPRLPRVAALALVGVWIAGAAIGLGGLLSSLLRVRGLKKRSSPLEGALADDLPWLTENRASEREIYLRLSYETEMPLAIGFSRPVILIPTELATADGLGAIEQLVMHEHAHLRRYDDWTNLVQRLIERVFWFNPVVWIVGRRIALEREIVADDAVVERTGRPQEYAKSLWRLAREMRMPEHAIVAPGALLTRKQISVRIESLLESRPAIPGLSPFASLGVGAAAIACFVAVATSAPALELPATTPAKLAQTRAEVRAPLAAAAGRAKHATFSEGIVRIVARAVNESLDGLDPALAKADMLRNPSRAVPAEAAPATLAKILAHCQGCDLRGRDLHGTDLRGIKLIGVNLAGANLSGARLDGAKLAGVDLSNVNFDGASLVNARFIGTAINGVSLRSAATSGLQMIGASLAGMDLHALDVRTLLEGCMGCNLENADLHGLDLHGIRLVGANLSNANLANTNLAGANLRGSNLNDANLAGANLHNVVLAGCSLANANLNGADTSGATFTGVNLKQDP
ncbi:MAG: hypothetical protein NVSMB64_13790 [Candidatus Velthaea sp.]